MSMVNGGWNGKASSKIIIKKMLKANNQISKGRCMDINREEIEAKSCIHRRKKVINCLEREWMGTCKGIEGSSQRKYKAKKESMVNLHRVMNILSLMRWA